MVAAWVGAVVASVHKRDAKKKPKKKPTRTFDMKRKLDDTVGAVDKNTVDVGGFVLSTDASNPTQLTANQVRFLKIPKDGKRHCSAPDYWIHSDHTSKLGVYDVIALYSPPLAEERR